MKHPEITVARMGDRYVANFRFSWEAKDIVKAAGFRFDGQSKTWYTTDAGIAGRLDPDLAAGALAASRATHAATAVPAPPGLDYLPYQKAGIAYAMSRRDTLIADEMGLGKTIQAIGVINSDPSVNRVLVICPASLKLNWRRELQRWLTPPMGIAIANGGSFPEADVVVINYDILGKHRAAIDQVQWDILVVDESHYLKSEKAQRTALVLGRWHREPAKIVRPIEARRRLFLTGTPILNRPKELWTLIQALNVQGMGRQGFMKFATRYCAATKTRWGWNFDGASNLEELQEGLRASVMVRRLKADVLAELPKKRRQVVVLPVADLTTANVVAAELATYERLEEAGLQESGAAFTELAALRHATALAKVPAVIDYLQLLLESADKVVVFAHHRDVIALLQERFGETAVSLTGETSLRDRQAAVDRFQGDPDCQLFIGSIQAAGVGLTLTAAQVAVFVESDWVPGNVTQAEDRLHRIGQKGSVLVQHLVLDNSLDSRMARVITDKQAVLDQVLDS